MNVHYDADFSRVLPTLILGSSLGADGSMWQPQRDAFSSDWNVVTFDLRGHGRSPLSPTPPSIDDFADDVVSVADALGVRTFAYCGLSIGGTIGQSLAARHPERVDALVLASTGLTILTPDALHERADRVLAEGMDWIAERSVPRWFTAGYRAQSPAVVEAKMAVMRTMAPQGYADACRALAGFDGTRHVGQIAAPTLVIAGDDDVATPPEGGRTLASLIAGARFELLADASHLCNLEQPERFSALLRGHLAAHAPRLR